MGRPKGSQNKAKSPTKYWLPEGVSLKEQPIEYYTKHTKLMFIDSEFGEFISSYTAIQQAKASTHPKAVEKRRIATNIAKYGHANPNSNPEVRSKAKKTMVERYGVENPLKNPVFAQKAKNTLKANYGVSNPMDSSEIKERLVKSNIEKYGVSNPMQTKEVQQTLKESIKNAYGVDNYSKTNEFKEKFFKTLYANGDGKLMRSSSEIELQEFVKSFGFDVKTGYLGGENPISLDVKINELKLAIEYNGDYWHSEANKNISPVYHLNKYKIAKEKGYRLIQIQENEWDNRKNQIKSFLKSALGKNERIIYARNTEIKEVSKDVANEFLEKYHILGKVQHKNAYGLYKDDELLCLITIGMHHRTNKEIVLNRFVGKEGTSVSGGLSKLVKYAKSIHGELVTFVDLRFSNGENWIKSGWKLIKQLSPDYRYYNTKNRKIISKQSRRKKAVKTPDGMTEHQHALQDGLARIYDCGKLKLKF